MATETWGDLEKSQADPSTIDQEIDSKIDTHLADPDAHLETGQSLQSHKASEIIDHLAGSIVNDKLAKWSVTVDKYYEDKFYINTTFESLDSFYVSKVGASADVIVTGDGCILRAGGANGDITYLSSVSLYTPVANDRNPAVQFLVHFPGDQAGIDAGFMCGFSDPFQETSNGFGFYWDGPTEKMYCRSCDGTDITDTEIVGFLPNQPNILRSELDYSNSEINFYLNAVLVATHSITILSIDSNVLFSIGVRSAADYSDFDVIVSNLIFIQDN